MRPLPSPNSLHFRDARPPPQNVTTWKEIYRPLLEVPTVPARTTMRSSKSHLNLKDLPQSMENLAVDRTANSTPAANHKMGLSQSRSAILTPPGDAKIELTDPNNKTKQYLVHDDNGGIQLKSQDEDDVFSADIRPNPPSVLNVPNLPDTPAAPYYAPSVPSAPPVVAGQEVLEFAANNTIAPRPDRLMGPITPFNAQGVLPPSATVFVANLSVHRTDAQLTESCHQAFDKFGTCVVTVRRDKHRHPFALIAYYTTQNAERAVKEGHDIVIDERTVRIEHADCRRSVILSRNGGGAITAEEAQELVGKYGPIEQMQPTTHADGRLHGVPEGMWVKYAYHTDSKDCLRLFNDPKLNDKVALFRVSEAPNLEPRSRPGVGGGSPVVQQGLRTPRSTTDQKSIFVGNLPDDTTEAELVKIFADYGQIKGCNVIRKPITGGQGFNIFGFIEYDTATEAEAAAEAEIDIRGARIRVEPKEYSARRHTRLQPYSQPPASDRFQPRAIAWGPSANVYQSPAAPMPYGFQPIYVQGPPGAFPHLPPGYSWTATPPNSVPRRRAPPPEDYYIDNSPPQYLSMHQAPFQLAPSYRDVGAENSQQPPARQYYRE